MTDRQYAKDLMELIPRAMTHIRGEMRAQAKADLTIAQFRTIARLSRGEWTNAELAEWIGVSAPAMSKTVDSLVARTLVRRAAGADRREVRLSLTPQGRKKFDRLSRGVQEALALRIKMLPAEHKAILRKASAVLREVFQ